MKTEDNPFTYKYFIDQHREAYSILKQKYPQPFDLFFVKAYLLGRIIELVLKTELILSGYTSAELKRKDTGSHDLVKLLHLLKSTKNYLLDSTTFDSIQHLNSFYSDKRYEYPQQEDVEVKNVAFLEQFIETATKKLEFHLSK